MKNLIKVKAENIGFDLFGVTHCQPPDHLEAYRLWLDLGMHGEMHYLERHLPLKADPLSLLASARSILVVGCNYWSETPSQHGVARYARGDDYHPVMKSMLERLGDEIKADFPELEFRAFVDSGPLMEKELATRAGLGWSAKNTLLINPQHGSWFLLGCLLTNLELEPDKPFESFHCGSCTRCIDACPTDAIIEPHLLDARRCISYWTIEQRETIPVDLRPQIGEWWFGCDICQEVCPWNQRFASPTQIEAFSPREWLQTESLADLIVYTPHQFELKIAPRSPIKRPKYRGFIRNISVVMGNQGHSHYREPLQQALQRHAEDPMLKEHLEWALNQLS